MALLPKTARMPMALYIVSGFIAILKSERPLSEVMASVEEPPLTMLGEEWALFSPCQESRRKSAGKFSLIYIQSHLIFKFILSSFARINQELPGIPNTNTMSHINYSSIKTRKR